VLAFFRHLPRQKSRQVRRRFASIVSTGLQKRLEPEDQDKFTLTIQFLERPGNKQEYEDLKQRAYD
jgi:hypothetical protein